MKSCKKTFRSVALIFAALAMVFVFPAVAAQTRAAQPAPATKALGQPEWEATVKEARKEGRVVIYGAGIGATANHLKKAFRDRFDIDLEFLQGRGNDIIQKVLTERRAGIYSVDIGNGGVTTWFTVIAPANIALPMEPLIMLDEVKDRTKWRLGRIPFMDKEKQVVNVASIRYPYICINTTLVKPNEINSFNDLLDPKWKGKMVISDPSISGTGNNWFAYMMIRLYGREKGAEYMKKLALNQPTLLRDERLQVEWVARGRYPILIAGKPTEVESFISLGAPLKWVLVKEAAPLSSGSFNFNAYKNAPHPHAQKVFVNWLLGKEAGEIIAKTSGYPSERSDVSHAGFDPAVVPKPTDTLEDEDYLAQKAGMPKLAGEIFREILQ